jgi:hypothetical protein
VQLPPPARPAQIAAAPRMPSAPQPQTAPPLQLSNVPRPPTGVGAQEARVQQTAASSNSRVSGFFENLFGQR